MKLLSEACDYGLRAVIWMAQRPAEPQKLKQIAEGIQAAPGYLIKVLQELTKAGILTARRGSQGGFTFQSDPVVLTALDVINAIDPLERIESCPLQIAAHSTSLCPMHRCVDDAMASIEETFRKTTIQDVISSFPASHSLCQFLGPPRQIATASIGASDPSRSVPDQSGGSK